MPEEKNLPEEKLEYEEVEILDDADAIALPELGASSGNFICCSSSSSSSSAG
jgi:thiazolylpeptide-type bacteriocin precursor